MTAKRVSLVTSASARRLTLGSSHASAKARAALAVVFLVTRSSLATTSPTGRPAPSVFRAMSSPLASKQGLASSRPPRFVNNSPRVHPERRTRATLVGTARRPEHPNPFAVQGMDPDAGPGDRAPTGPGRGAAGKARARRRTPDRAFPDRGRCRNRDRLSPWGAASHTFPTRTERTSAATARPARRPRSLGTRPRRLAPVGRPPPRRRGRGDECGEAARRERGARARTRYKGVLLVEGVPRR